MTVLTASELKAWMNRVDQEIELAMSLDVKYGVFFKPERDAAMNTEQYYEVLQEAVLDFFCDIQASDSTGEVQKIIDSFQYK